MSLQFTGPRLKGQDQRQNMLKRLIGFGFFLQLIVPLTAKHINLVYNTIFNNIIQFRTYAFYKSLRGVNTTKQSLFFSCFEIATTEHLNS